MFDIVLRVYCGSLSLSLSLPDHTVKIDLDSYQSGEVTFVGSKSNDQLMWTDIKSWKINPKWIDGNHDGVYVYALNRWNYSKERTNEMEEGLGHNDLYGKNIEKIGQ